MKDLKECGIPNLVSTNETGILNLSENSEYNSPFSFNNMENSMSCPLFVFDLNNSSGISEFKISSNIYNREMGFENQNISDFALKFDTELNNISSNIENNISTKKNATIDNIINSNRNIFQKGEENMPEDEKLNNETIPEIFLSKKKKDRPSKLGGHFPNLEEKKRSILNLAIF